MHECLFVSGDNAVSTGAVCALPQLSNENAEFVCRNPWGVIWQSSLTGGIVCVVDAHLSLESGGRCCIAEKVVVRGRADSPDFFFSVLRCYWQCFDVDFSNTTFYKRVSFYLSRICLASSLLKCVIWTSLKSLCSVNPGCDEPLWSVWKSSKLVALHLVQISGIRERLFVHFNGARISLKVPDNWSVKINFRSFWRINIMIFTQFYSSEQLVLQKIFTLIHSWDYISLKKLGGI